MLKTISYFKALKETRRFRKNQKVWIVHEYGNFCIIKFRYRGSGRYVSGILNKENQTVANATFKQITVHEDFYNKIRYKIKSLHKALHYGYSKLRTETSPKK